MSAPNYVYGPYQEFSEGHAHRYLLPALKTALGAPVGPILDLGCGNGWVANALIDEGYEVYGVDASESGIRIADQQRPGHFFVMNVESEALPTSMAGKNFSTVISTEVIEHLYQPRAFLKRAKKVLTEAGGGRLILTTPYHGYLKNLALAIAGKLDAHYTVLWDGGHIKFFSRRTLEQMLKDEGLTPVGFIGAGRAPLLWKSMVVTAVAIAVP